MQAKSAAEAAVAMNRRIFTRFTGTPTFREASVDPPTAKIQLPNLVRSRTQVATATTTSHQSSSTLNSAPPIVNRTALNSFESGSSAAAAPTPLTIVWPLETSRVMARSRAAQHVQRAEGHDERREAGPGPRCSR